ncbi:amino acid-binding protein [Adlercreutzia muris]|uniref:amino acid-binding protein n=1 Tax=Adlercreutzia muris TaxID=1796610 RepID=UPI001F57AC7C|nr:amino acid-binding protein [Adlercreutzia muris]
MTVSQISVFANSRPGHLGRVLDRFEEVGVSVRGFSASDTGEYGILRFVVDRPEEALAALRQDGCACTVAPVLCLKLADEPGELARVMGVLARCGINVVYSYSMISTYIVLSTTDPDRARELLASEPVEMITQEDIARFSAARQGKEIER